METDFVEVLWDLNLEQIVREPSLVAGTTLDLICTDLGERLSEVAIDQPGMSDHFMIEACITTPSSVNTSDQHKTQVLYHQADINSFRSFIQDVFTTVRTQVQNEQGIDIVWNTFSQGLHTAVKTYVPTKQVEPEKANQPLWFNHNAMKACSKRQKLCKKYRLTGQVRILDKYKA